MKRATNGRPYVGVRAGCPASVAVKFFGESRGGFFQKPPCGYRARAGANRLARYFGCTRPTSRQQFPKVFRGVKRGLFSKSPLLRACGEQTNQNVRCRNVGVGGAFSFCFFSLCFVSLLSRFSLQVQAQRKADEGQHPLSCKQKRQKETRRRKLFEKSFLRTPSKTFRRLAPGCWVQLAVEMRRKKQIAA